MSADSTVPKLAQLTSTIETLANSAPVVVASSVKVYRDEGLSEHLIEKALRESGVVVVVEPLVELALRDQSGSEWLCDAELVVRVKVNQSRNRDTAHGGAGVDIYALCASIMGVMTRSRHPGGEFAKLADKPLALSQFDKGLWSYDLSFTKEAFYL